MSKTIAHRLSISSRGRRNRKWKTKSPNRKTNEQSHRTRFCM